MLEIVLKRFSHLDDTLAVGLGIRVPTKFHLIRRHEEEIATDVSALLSVQLHLALRLLSEKFNSSCQVSSLLRRDILLEVERSLIFKIIFLLLFGKVSTRLLLLLVHQDLGLVKELVCTERVADLRMESSDLLEGRDHLNLVFSVESFLNAKEVMPHVEGVSVVTHALEEGGKEGDDLLKEGMIPVPLNIGNHRLENAIEGHLDALGHLLTHLPLLHR